MAVEAPDPRALIAAAIDLTRGTRSYAELNMVIHRPAWERRSSIVAWTRGREDALIRFVAPPRDAGNATLKSGERMWTFSPQINRVMRLPYSMMAQGWAGSDFSYNDLSRTDQLLRDYDLELVEVLVQGDFQVYRIEATPRDDAAVVWGREDLVLRDDSVVLEHTFLDQSLLPVKRLEALTVGTLGGRTFATRLRMSDLESDDHWTEIEYTRADFDVMLDDALFTVFALQSGRAP
ncbi:MAG: outer membrane lipoprotein-sorting protein [Pseudomonadales bacterium]